MAVNQEGRQSLTGDRSVVTEAKKPKLTLFQSSAIVIASLGGTALFVAMSTMMKSTGSVGVMLIVILLSGLINYSLANCFTEVATLLPKAGGPYFFIKEVFGNLPAFLFIWGFFFLVIVPVWAFQSLTSALYILQLFFPGCRPPDSAAKLLSVCMLVAVVLINCLYFKYVTKFQTILTFSKIIVMVILLGLGLVALITGGGENYSNIFAGSSTQPGDYAVSVLSGMFLFGGWQLITFLLEEMEEPERTLPKTLSISFGFTMVMSELIVAAYFLVLSTQDVMISEAVALLFTDKICRPLSPVISILVTLSCLGSQNAVVLGQSRVISATARMGHMPRFLSYQNETYNMPWAASSVACMFALLMLMFGNLSQMIIMTSFYATVMCLAVVLCLIALRVRQPHARRPMKVWVITIVVQVIINLAVIFMGIYQQPSNIGFLAVFLLCGIPVYCVCISWQPKPLNSFMDKIAVFFQKVLVLRKPSE